MASSGDAKKSRAKPAENAKTSQKKQTSNEQIRAYLKEKRAAEKDVVVPSLTPDQEEWRAMLEADVFDWLRWFGDTEFSRPFTDQQREMVAAILSAITDGGDQAIAAPRGEGKTSITEWVVMYAILRGLVAFAVIFAATGADAESILQSIRDRFADNERLLEYYPEVCMPIVALENTAQRARTQTCSGTNRQTKEVYQRHPTRFSWCGREISFPRIPGSVCAGAIIATRGLDASVRGMKRGSLRPQIAIIDDPDTDDTANSEDQSEKLERKIDRNIAGLAGQERRLARVVLTTIQNRRCVSFRLCDPQSKPSFHGRRFKFLIEPPTNANLWEEYVALKRVDWEQGTSAANELYAARRDEMDAGAVVANPWRRGDDNELSALQFYYNEIARIGPEAVASEYQNDPAEDSGPLESGITPFRIAKKLSGFAMGVVPPNCTVLSQGMDVGKRYLHWVVRAFSTDGSSYTIDYGVTNVYGVTTGSEEGLDDAIQAAVSTRMEELAASTYMKPDGEVVPVTMTLVDARYRTQAIYAACSQLGLGIRPVMGYGKSHGCVKMSWTDAKSRTKDRRPGGDGWFEARQQIGQGKSIWMVAIDADRWKAYEHDRWLTAPGKPGCLWLYGEPGPDPKRLSGDEFEHTRKGYPSHICAEIEVEETIDGVVKRYWKARGENHWLDASSYANVAAQMLGAALHGSGGKRQMTKPRVSLAQMAKG